MRQAYTGRTMTRSLLLLSLLSSAALCHPQNIVGGAGKAPKVPVVYGRLSGTIYLADSHRPARGATVMAMSATSDKAEAFAGTPQISRSGLDGSYTLPHLPVGDYAVFAFAPGYVSPLSGDDMKALDSHDAAKLRPVLDKLGVVHVAAQGGATKDVTLERGAVITGRVLYSDGTPATGTNIDIRDIHAASATPNPLGGPDVDESSMMSRMFSQQSLTTNDLGEFRIAGLAAGTYRVAAVQSLSSGGDDNFFASVMGAALGVNMDGSAVRVYAGDTMHRKDAKTFEVRNGDNVPDVIITLPLNAFHKVRGSVSAPDGRTLNVGAIKLTDTTDDALVYHTTLTSDGTFEFPNVPSGTYRIDSSNGFINRSQVNPMLMNNPMFASRGATAAFADSTATVIVKDGDPADVALSAKEIPLPKNAKPAANDDDDN